ncbi:diguanylate cyclase domain-containing protein, partial [Aeromonas salmonicida]
SDDAHREFFSRPTLLHTGGLTGEGDKHQLQKTYAPLLALATRHFNNEEAILAKLGYAELDTHRQEHQKLLHRADSLYPVSYTHLT